MFLTPKLYLQCRETARYQENLPPSLAEYAGVTTREWKENIQELEDIEKIAKMFEV